MRALIIGAAGFVGAYLSDYLVSRLGWEVCVSKRPHEQLHCPGTDAIDLDILDPDAVKRGLESVRPDCILHLAAQSSVALSWERPALTVDVNIKGCVHLLEAVRSLDYKPRVLLVGSAEEYGPPREDELPVGESNPLRPGNIYAVTKACQGMIGRIYAEAYGLDILIVRAFNHIGPGQSPQFVVSDFCRQVAEIEAGAREPVLRVGNLSAKRDFTDVRDVVRAYAMLIEKGNPGETYNVGSGNAVAISDILDRILSLSSGKIEVERDPARFRPVDVPVVGADISKITRATGWKPEIPLEQTLRETLDYWRRALSPGDK